MARARGLGDIIVSSRPYDEYRAMFDLTDAEILAGPVLDCPGGAGSFAAEVRDRGGRAVSADPVYAMPPEELVAGAKAGFARGLRYLDDNRDAYVWSFFDGVDDLVARRGGALERFAEDFHGPDERYVAAALPELPFPDGGFRLVLSGYLLFAYPDHLDDADHEAALRELLRVAREEVRLYPLIDTAYVRHPRIDALRRMVEAEGVATEVRRVGYAFQRGATEVLILRPPRRR
jgi:SAM-dependent methyltransferase